MKKIIASLLTAALCLTVVACGNANKAPAAEKSKTGSQSEAAKENAASAKKVVINFAAQADSTPATKAVIEAFNKSQDKYEAKWTNMTNDSQAMRTQLINSLKAGSSDYDVISMDVVWAGDFAAAGYLEPLDPMMKDAGLKSTDFNSGSMQAGKYAGKQYALPFFPDLGVLYIRKDIVSSEDAAKLESGNYSWKDLQEMALKYKGKEGTKDGFVYQAKQYEGLICNANEFTNNWKDLKGGLEAMKEMADSKAAPDNILVYTEGETANSFIKGESVFARNWPYMWGSIKSDGTIKQDQVAIAPLPNGDTVGGWLLGVNKNSKNKEGAWALIKFIATAEGQKIMSTQGGYIPGFNALLSNADVLKANELLGMKGFQEALKRTISRPVSADYAKVSDALQQAIHKYLSGESDVDTAVKAMEAALAPANSAS